MISPSSSTASSSPATSANVTVGWSLPTGFARDLPEAQDAATATLRLVHEPEEEPEDEHERQQAQEQRDQRVLRLAVDLEVADVGAPDLAGELVRVLLREPGLVLGAVGERALDHVVLVQERDAADLVVGEVLLERREIERAARVPRSDDAR